jgi:GH25 family lysozyme M1 (1,4-beta-N-acetylmuramidase)
MIADVSRGIDVSKYQGEVDWKRVAGEGIKFAFARAVEDTRSIRSSSTSTTWS